MEELKKLSQDEQRVASVTMFIATVVGNKERFGRSAFDCSSVVHDGTIASGSPADKMLKIWRRLDADFSITQDDTNDLEHYLRDNDFVSLPDLLAQGRANHDARITQAINKLETGC